MLGVIAAEVPNNVALNRGNSPSTPAPTPTEVIPHHGHMPEGDAVRRSALALDAALRDRVLVASDFRVPRFATIDLTGQRVVETVAIGKHLLTRTDAGLSIHSHRRMEGKWVTGAADLRTGPYHQIGSSCAPNRPRPSACDWPWSRLRRPLGERLWIGHLGPDILADDFDPRMELPSLRPVVDTLLDQKVIAGLGTMWAAEAAFIARASPYANTGNTDLAPACSNP